MHVHTKSLELLSGIGTDPKQNGVISFRRKRNNDKNIFHFGLEFGFN